MGRQTFWTATLVWVDNADSEEGYVVELQGADGSWSRAAELPANSTSWTSEALGSNGTYVYRVSAWNAYGFSSWVETEVLGASAPSAPSDLAFGAYDAVRKTLAMSWTDNSDDETSFRVEYSVDGGAWKLAKTLGANATGRVATGVEANSLYSFRVRAENAYGVSDWAYGDYATTPAAASDLSAVLNVSSAPTATLTWVDNARYETGYAIEVLDSTSGVWSRIAELPANSTSWTSEVLDFGATYVYSVVALTSDASRASKLSIAPWLSP